MNTVSFIQPSLSSRERICVAESLTHEQFATDHALHQFGEAFAKFVGARFGVPVTSRAAGLHLVLETLEIGPGDEVIVSELTDAATVAPIRHCGATPVFVDVDPETWCVTAATVRQALTPRTKAVVVGDLYQIAPEMPRIRATVHRLGIPVIEDATLAWGQTHLHHHAGTLGDIGIFGFDRSTTLTTGEGGMIVTNHPQAGQALQAHGLTAYPMSIMQAALGYAQLQRGAELLEAKRQILAWYGHGLTRVHGVSLRNSLDRHAEPNPTDCTVSIDPALPLPAHRLVEELASRDIEARLLPRPLSSLASFAHLPQSAVGKSRNKHAYHVASTAVVLPSGPGMTREQVAEVCASLTTILARRSQPVTRRQAA